MVRQLIDKTEISKLLRRRPFAPSKFKTFIPRRTEKILNGSKGVSRRLGILISRPNHDTFECYIIHKKTLTLSSIMSQFLIGFFSFLGDKKSAEGTSIWRVSLSG